MCRRPDGRRALGRRAAAGMAPVSAATDGTAHVRAPARTAAAAKTALMRAAAAKRTRRQRNSLLRASFHAFFARWFRRINRSSFLELASDKYGLSVVHVLYAYGFTIIPLTVVVKAVTLPLTKQQVESTWRCRICSRSSRRFRRDTRAIRKNTNGDCSAIEDSWSQPSSRMSADFGDNTCLDWTLPSSKCNK